MKAFLLFSVSFGQRFGQQSYDYSNYQLNENDQTYDYGSEDSNSYTDDYYSLYDGQYDDSYDTNIYNYDIYAELDKLGAGVDYSLYDSDEATAESDTQDYSIFNEEESAPFIEDPVEINADYVAQDYSVDELPTPDYVGGLEEEMIEDFGDVLYDVASFEDEFEEVEEEDASDDRLESVAVEETDGMFANPGARYFFTAVPINPTTGTAGAGTTGATTAAATTVSSTWKCWHCDESSLAACAQNGAEKECHSGDYGSCMLEVTEQNGSFKNICMGCKQKDACEAAKLQNFWDYLPPATAAAREANSVYDRFTLCKPEDQYNSTGRRSYCRQCCYRDNCFNVNGYTNAQGTTEAWTSVIAWNRSQWKANL